MTTTKNYSAFRFNLLRLAIFSGAVALAMLIPLLAKAQTVPTDHQTFFDSIGSYFTSFNTNYDDVLKNHKGDLWLGANFKQAAHNGSEIGADYRLFGNISLRSVTRFEDVTGDIEQQLGGLGYNLYVHDVKLTGYAAGGYDFNSSKAFAEVGLDVTKQLTEHTFAGTGLGLRIGKGEHLVFRVFTGFLF